MRVFNCLVTFGLWWIQVFCACYSNLGVLYTQYSSEMHGICSHFRHGIFLLHTGAIWDFCALNTVHRCTCVVASLPGLTTLVFDLLQYCKRLVTRKQIAQNHNTNILYESNYFYAGSLVLIVQLWVCTTSSQLLQSAVQIGRGKAWEIWSCVFYVIR